MKEKKNPRENRLLMNELCREWCYRTMRLAADNSHAVGDSTCREWGRVCGGTLRI